MYNITFISTIHKEIGKCNADELCKIIEKINPEVIFLEALDETYSDYDKSMNSSFGVYHKKLEIKAIQKYNLNMPFKYVPVLDKVLSDSFDKKYSIVCKMEELQKLIDNHASMAEYYGFEFLNSVENIERHEEMRNLENYLLNDSALSKAVDDDVDAYEDSMLRNIYSYCKNHKFNTAIFMCGSAHRKSIIEKIKGHEESVVCWRVFPDGSTS